MGNRLSKIYTRTGDHGTTALATGERLAKNSLVFVAMGDVDELNSHIGMITALLDDDKLDDDKLDDDKLDDDKLALKTKLNIIQHLLFNLGGELAMPDFAGINGEHIRHLEHWIDDMNQALPYLKDFILPKGTPVVCQTHIARTVARRAERSLVALHQDGYVVREDSLKFINRLSDYLFVLSRHLTPDNLVAETLWNSQILKDMEKNQF